MGGTQPYASPDLRSDETEKDPALEPVSEEERERVAGDPQQRASLPRRPAGGGQPGSGRGEDDRSPGAGADPHHEIPSAAEAEGRDLDTHGGGARDDDKAEGARRD